MLNENSEFTAEISRLRKINEEITRSLQSKEHEILNLKNNHIEEIRKFDLIIKNQNEQIIALINQKEVDLNTYQTSVHSQIEKIRNLEKEILKYQKRSLIGSPKKQKKDRKNVDTNLNGHANKVNSKENSVFSQKQEKKKSIFNEERLEYAENINSMNLNGKTDVFSNECQTTKGQFEENVYEEQKNMKLKVLSELDNSNKKVVPKMSSDYRVKSIEELDEENIIDEREELKLEEEKSAEHQMQNLYSENFIEGNKFEQRSNQKVGKMLFPAISMPKQTSAELFEDGTSVQFQSRYLKIIEKLQASLKIEENDKINLIKQTEHQEVSRLDSIRENKNLNEQILMLETEKEELVGHIEVVNRQFEELEEKWSRVLKENARLENEVAKHNDMKSSGESELETARSQSMNYSIKLNDLQLKFNRLTADYKNAMMENESKAHKNKKIITEHEQEIFILSQKNQNLREEIEEKTEKLRVLKNDCSYQIIEYQKQLAFQEIEFSNKINELNQIVSDLTKELKMIKFRSTFEKKNAEQNRKSETLDEKCVDINQALINENTESKSADSLNFNQLESQQFDQANFNSQFQKIFDIHDNKSEVSAFERIKRGSISQTEPTLKEDLVRNHEFSAEKNSKNEKNSKEMDPNLITLEESAENQIGSRRKRFSVTENSAKKESVVIRKQRYSICPQKSKPEELEKSFDEQNSAESNSDQEENDAPNQDLGHFSKINTNELNELFKLLEVKTSEVCDLKMLLDSLKCEVITLKNELVLRDLKVNSLQESFKMFEIVHIEHVKKSQKEIEEMMMNFIQAKIQCNEIQSEKDIMQMTYNKTMKAKEYELNLYKRQMDDLNEIGKTRRMTGLGRL